MRSSGILLAASLLFLAGCASPESRLKSGLSSAGVPDAQAACMAKEMSDKLSITQLRRIGSLGSLRDANVGDMNTDQFLHRVRALNDPKILSVSVGSAVLCASR